MNSGIYYAVRLKPLIANVFYPVIAVGIMLLQPVVMRKAFWVVGFVFMLVGAAASQAQEYHLDIPSQKVDDALAVLAKETESLLLFPYDDIRAVHSTAVHGQYRLEEALGLLLRNTGLQGSLTHSGVISVSAIKNYTSEGEYMMNRKKNILASYDCVFCGGWGFVSWLG